MLTVWKETRFLNVPLTQDEVRERGEQLADLIKEHTETERDFKKERDRMKDALDGLNGRIQHFARIVNERVEERSVSVELRVNLTLGMVEEVRADTGEVVKTRSVTPEDKIRAQSEAQLPLVDDDKK